MNGPRVEQLRIKIFADGANLDGMRALAQDPRIKGFTTNPTLMRAAGVSDYKTFAFDVLDIVGDRPVSFEVFADDFPTMERPRAELLWASPRELLNIFQADAVGCHIITAVSDVLEKLPLVGRDLDGYSRETVEMFYRDALAAGYSIPLAERQRVS